MSYWDMGLWFSAKGRVNRPPLFVAFLLAVGILGIGAFVPAGFMIVYVPIFLLSAYALIALGIKRCHDRDKSGFFLLLNLVPLLNFWPLIELLFFKGAEGSNEYGPDPLD